MFLLKVHLKVSSSCHLWEFFLTIAVPCFLIWDLNVHQDFCNAVHCKMNLINKYYHYEPKCILGSHQCCVCSVFLLQMCWFQCIIYHVFSSPGGRVALRRVHQRCLFQSREIRGKCFLLTLVSLYIIKVVKIEVLELHNSLYSRSVSGNLANHGC